MAQPPSGTVCILPQGRSPQLGFEGHLPWDDAVHGYTIDRTDPLVQLPTVSAMAATHNGWLSIKRVAKYGHPFNLNRSKDWMIRLYKVSAAHLSIFNYHWKFSA